MKKSIILSLTGVLLVAGLAIAAGCSAGPAGPDGAALYAQKCLICHSESSMANYDYETLAEWQDLIDRMQSKGSGYTDEEGQAIAKYLHER